jgi:metal-sulfur cluster biosynthetic enzyme
LDIDPANAVNIRMTLTAPGCPVADMIVRMVTKGVEAIEDVAKCDVDLVWEPPWSMSLLSEEAKLQLGLI